MKVWVAGEDQEGSLARMCRDGLAQCGVETALVDCRPAPLFSRLAARITGLGRITSAWQQVLANSRFRARIRADQPDITLVIKGELLWPATLRAIRSQGGGRLVNWNPDSPFNPLTSTPSLVASLPCYHCVFTWHQGLLEPIRRAGAPRTAYLPFGYDPRLHVPAAAAAADRAALASTVCFCGTWSPDRKELLEALAEFGLALWGNGWEQADLHSPVRACWRGPAVYGADVCRRYGAAKIVVNLLRPQNQGAHNMRTFEIPAANALHLATRSPDHQAWFGEGEGIVCFETRAELMSQTAHYLTHEHDAHRIAATGRQRLEDGGHSYADRMHRLLEEVQQT